MLLSNKPKKIHSPPSIFILERGAKAKNFPDDPHPSGTQTHLSILGDIDESQHTIVKTTELQRMAEENSKRNPFPPDKQDQLKKQLSDVNKLLVKQNENLKALQDELKKKAEEPPKQAPPK